MGLEARALELFGLMSENEIRTSSYKSKALEIKRLIGKTTFSTKGKYGKQYFVRISSGDGDATSDKLFLKGSYFAPSEMVSNDFLFAVFTGIYPHFDFRITESLKVSDSLLRVNTLKGPSFYRYNGDIYGFDDQANPKGRLWVLLTAERGIYELMKGNLQESLKYLRAIENFATDTYILPEQVFENGQPTESAAPLAWSHASYMILHDFLISKVFPSFVTPWI
jgi:glucoamylase